MLHPSVAYAPSPGKGKGVFATETLPRGTIVWHPCRSCSIYTILQLSACPPLERGHIERLGYRLFDQSLLVPCAGACYLNHSCQANVLDFGLDFGLAVRDIERGEEVCCDSCTLEEVEGSSAERAADWTALVKGALSRVLDVEQPLHSSLRRDSLCYYDLLANPDAQLLDKGRTVCRPFWLPDKRSGAASFFQSEVRRR